MFVATIVLVSEQNGKEVPTSKSTIGLNTYVSVFSFVFKASLLFVIGNGLSALKWGWFSTPRQLVDLNTIDEASRGAYGSLKLFWRLAPSAFLTSYWTLHLGALITLVSLVMDPFSQQLVGTESCRIPWKDASNASVSRAAYFGDGDTKRFYADGYPYTSLGMQDAILGPLYNSDGQWPQPKPECASQNCDFGTFFTLSFAGGCTDASAQVQVRNDTYPIKLDEKTTMPVPFFNYTVGTGIVQSGQLPPSSFPVATSHYDLGEVFYNSATKGNMPSQGIFEEGPSAFLNITVGQPGHPIDRPPPEGSTVLAITVLAAFLNDSPFQPPLFGGPNCTAGQKEDWQCKGYGAAFCELHPNLVKLRSRVENGALKEDVLGEWSMGYGYGLANLTCLGEVGADGKNFTERLNVTGAHYTIEGHSMAFLSDLQLTGRHESYFALDSFQPPSIQRCIYAVESKAMMNLGLLAPAYFQGAVVSVKDDRGFVPYDPPSTENGGFSGKDSFNSETLTWPQALRMWLSNETVPFINGSQHAERFFQQGEVTFDSVNTQFRAMAQGLSTYVRRTGGPGVFSEAARGSMQLATTCYVIRWPWLVYPSLVVALLMVFLAPLVFMIARGDLGPVEDWKGNVLPLVIHGLHSEDEDMRAAQQRIDLINDTRSLAKAKWVALNKTGEGWKLS